MNTNACARNRGKCSIIIYRVNLIFVIWCLFFYFWCQMFVYVNIEGYEKTCFFLQSNIIIWYFLPNFKVNKFLNFHECYFYLIRQVHRRMGGQQSARSTLPTSHPGCCPQRSQASPRQENQEPKARINDFAPPSGHHGRIK